MTSSAAAVHKRFNQNIIIIVALTPALNILNTKNKLLAAVAPPISSPTSAGPTAAGVSP